MARHAKLWLGIFLLAFAIVTPARAASVVDQVPRDALGFVLVRNLSQADVKIAKGLGALRLPLPAPLAMIKSITGVNAGLDSDRDLLVVMLPTESKSQPFRFALWLPVKDYDALVRSLDGHSEGRIAAVTIAGEDLLVAHVQDWAVVVDPDERERLGELGSQPAENSRSVTDWAPLVNASDVTLVVFRNGIQAALAAAARDPDVYALKARQTANGFNNPFGGANPGTNSWKALVEICVSIQQGVEGVPEIKRLATEAQAIGCGLRLDDAGNAVAMFRVALSPDAVTQSGAQSHISAPRLYDGGPFVMNGSGLVSQRWIMPLVAPYVRQTAADLASDYGVKVEDAGIAQFQASIEEAVAQVQAVSFLTRPGGDQDGVYTNSFLTARVVSADDFVKSGKTAIDRWNTMLGKSDGGAGLVFEENSIVVAGHDGTEYSIDMAKAVGAAPLPEARQTMERLFGPGGRFRTQLVKVDDTTVLISIASEDQLARPIHSISEKVMPARADDGKLDAVADLLSGNSDWKCFFSIDGYNHWLKRQMEAMVGPVIGGPIVRPFPESPPIGATGGAMQNAIWAEVAVPANTLRGVGEFLHP